MGRLDASSAAIARPRRRLRQSMLPTRSENRNRAAPELGQALYEVSVEGIAGWPSWDLSCGTEHLYRSRQAVQVRPFGWRPLISYVPDFAIDAPRMAEDVIVPASFI